MKIRVFLFLLIFAITNIAFSQVYINSKYSYRINLPKSWEKKEFPSKENPAKVTATNDEEFSISVIVKENDYYIGKKPENLGMNYFIELMKTDYNNINLLQTDYEYIENEQILFAQFSVSMEEYEMFFGQYYFIAGSTLYIIQLEGRSGVYQLFEETGKGYAYTFSITGNKPGKYVKSDAFGFRIAFPDGWTVFAVAIPFQAFDKNNGLISVEVVESQDYKGLSIFDIAPETLIDAIRTKKPKAMVIEDSKLTLDNISARFIKYKWDEKIKNFTTQVTVDHYYTIRGSRFYIIQCQAPTKDFDKYKEIFQKCVESFQYL
ncbi:MAG: hypothetical protein JW917_09100 [Ignavibacteria bacterium]|nr:hypothetical protein [Ignavibacteria bacterium]